MVKTLDVVNCTIVDSECICRNAAAISADMMPCLLRNCTMEVALRKSSPPLDPLHHYPSADLAVSRNVPSAGNDVRPAGRVAATPVDGCDSRLLHAAGLLHCLEILHEEGHPGAAHGR